MAKLVKKSLKRISFELDVGLLGRKSRVSGYEIVPGIAVDLRDGKWYVSHIGSGLGLVLSEVLNFSTRKGAVAYVRNLVRKLPEIDWTVDQATLTDLVSKAIAKRCSGVLPAGSRYQAIKEILYPKSKEERR